MGVLGYHLVVGIESRIIETPSEIVHNWLAFDVGCHSVCACRICASTNTKHAVDAAMLLQPLHQLVCLIFALLDNSDAI